MDDATTAARRVLLPNVDALCDAFYHVKDTPEAQVTQQEVGQCVLDFEGGLTDARVPPQELRGEGWGISRSREVCTRVEPVCGADGRVVCTL